MTWPLTVFRIVHLMDEICHIIFAVHIASFAVVVGSFFDFVLDHRFVGLEMLVAVLVAAFDLARHPVCRSALLNLTKMGLGGDLCEVVGDRLEMQRCGCAVKKWAV